MTYLKTEKIEGRERNRPLKDYAGTRFGKLVAVSLVEREPKWNGHKWLFKCDCGMNVVSSIKSVRAGHTTSCGCAHTEMLVARNTKHGLSGSPEYKGWKDMRARCGNPKQKDFRDYGGRGIKICAQWSSFEVFLHDMGSRPEGHTLDRIDVNGNYEPSNCRWAPAKVQANNKRSNHAVEIDGVSKTLQEWSDHFGIEASKARYRLKQGWPMNRVFSKEDHRR